MAPGIAIVGISTELPSGAHSSENLDHESFGDFLLNYGEAYEPIPPDRFNINAWKGNTIGKIHIGRGAFLKRIDLFDNVEFGISSRDARAMAPVAKKLLEHCFLALLDSGIDYRMKNVGCYTSGNSFDLSSVSDPDEYEPRGSFSGYPSMVANRVSNHLDLLGPSVPTDTACSSTLTALHLAVQAILNGECEAAVVGGCQLNHRFMDWITYSQGSLLAKDGKCKPFDSFADGFARAEGCVAVVIKPLDAALMDHDRVYATILGTSINSTGSGGPPGAPVAEAQRDAMLEAFRRASRRPQDVDYVELHATGTAKGDPTEANWVGEHFKREDELLIGSVKGNIGHTEITAFLASLSKVITIFQRQVIPPTVNFRTPNPAIRWEQYKLRVPTVPTPLSCRSGRRSLISMASSGIGGSNGHVVLEGPPPMPPLTSENWSATEGAILLMAGGLSPRAVSSIADSIVDRVTNGSVEPSVLSTVLGRRSKQMTWRSYAVTGSSPVEFSSPQHSPRGKIPIVFVFSGQGPQHGEMGKMLFRLFPVFRNSVMDMDEVYKEVTGKSIVHDYGLFGSDRTTSDLLDTWPISLILPSIAIFQMALFDMLTSLGIKPDIIVGHSAGETAVLYASGAASKAMVVELAIIRGQVFSSVENLGGTMAALSCTPEDVTQILAEVRSENPDEVIEIACFNSPSAVAIAGHDMSIDRALALAHARGIFSRKIHTRVPIHSSMMEGCRDEYVARSRDLFHRHPGSHCPNIPTYSTLTGNLFSGPFDAEYFWDSTRSQVCFTQAIAAIGTSSNFTFVEIAPHPVLSSYISSMVHDSCAVLSTVRRPKLGGQVSEHRDILELLGRITVAGHNCVDFTNLNGRACYESKLDLSAYPFMKKQYPLYPDTPAYVKQMEGHRGPLNHNYLKVNQDTHPTLGEHVIRGEPIMPAAGFLEMAIEFGASCLMNVNLLSMLPLSAKNPVKVEVCLDGSYWTVKSIVPSPEFHRNTGSELPYASRLHADGYLSFEEPRSEVRNLDISVIRKRCHGHVGSEFYSSLSYFSSYGPHFQRITNMYYGADEALVSIKGMDRALAEDGDYILHPAILDACIQATAYKPFHGDFNPNVYYLPARVGALVVHQSLRTEFFPAHIYAYVRLKEWAPSSMCYDIMLVDDIGRSLCTLQSLEVAKHMIGPPAIISGPLHVTLQSMLHPRRPRRPSRPFIAAPYASSKKFACLEDMAKNDQTCPVLNGLPFDDAILVSAEAMRRIFSSLSGDGSRVVRILVAGGALELFAPLVNVMREFPTLFYELFTDFREHLELFPTDPSFGTCRITDVDLTNPEAHNMEAHSFDAVLVLQTMTGEVDPEAVLKTCNDLLLCGGALILTERNNGTFPPVEVARLEAYSNVLETTGFSILRNHYVHTGDLGCFTIQCQTVSKQDILDLPPLFDMSKGFMFEYSYGLEGQLQWDLSGLNILQELDVWVLAKQGRHGGSARGLIRALRREYLLWTIRLVIFPASYTQELRLEALLRIPLSMKNEMEIVVPEQDHPMVPRLIPLPRLSVATAMRKDDQPLPLEHVSVHVHCWSAQSDSYVSGFLGSIVRSNTATGLEEGTLVVGLTAAAPGEYMSIDAATVCPVSSSMVQHKHFAIACIPGFVTAVIAPGLSMFTRPNRLRSLRILVTHADTTIGRSISYVYSNVGVSVIETTKDISLFDVASMGRGRFHLIISGYEGRLHVQVIKTLLQPHGRLFLWNDKTNGLAGLLKQDTCTVGDALRSAVNLMEEGAHAWDMDIPKTSTMPTIQPAITEHVFRDVRAVFKPDKTYLVLGGIGSLGAHIAMFMQERGARHIVLTSRSGKQGLRNDKNLKSRRIFEYLKGVRGLHIRLEAVDATSTADMRSLVDTLRPALGGCIVLSAVVSDGIFQHLRKDDFSRVFTAKIDVLDVLRATIDISTLEFLIAFSSVSGVFGVGGQSNYGAANTALEEEMSLLSNGFCFACPGILDSSMMLGGGVDARESRLSHFIEWSIPAEDMLLWLDDAICRYQNGQQFTQYIPSLDWQVMDRTLGMPKLGEHLVPTRVSEQSTSDNELDRVADTVRNVLNVSVDDFSPDIPFTSYGLDSLSAARLSFMLRTVVEVTQIQLLADLSLNDLQRKITQLSSDITNVKEDRPVEQSKTRKMEELLAKYTAGMKNQPAVGDDLSRPSSDHVVLLTGSTGALGCHILSHLLNNNDVKRVYAFNRKRLDGASLLHRQTTAFGSHGLPSSFARSSKLILVEGDLTGEDLGISNDLMEELLSSITHIIHNAWRVDFFTPLSGFEDLIKGTRRLLDFATRSRLRLPLVSFISSIGVYTQPKDAGIAVEAPILDPKVAARTGYMESKWVAERLVQVASEKLSLRTNVIRVGLLTGGINGSWDTSQWLPALVQSGVYVGCLPEGDDIISWLPVDMAAAAIVDMRVVSNETLHLIHPHPGTWATVMQPIASMLDVPLVPYVEWFARLESTARHDASSANSPRIHGLDGNTSFALNLIDFYRMGIKNSSRGLNTESMGLLPRVASDKGVCASATLRDDRLVPLGPSDAESWLKYWREVGFLPRL